MTAPPSVPNTVNHHDEPEKQSHIPPHPTPFSCCPSCGGPTTHISPSPSSSPWSDSSPPPVYRPIRTPALNLPPPNSQAIILSPIPQPQKIPILSPPYLFQTPSKKILSPSHALSFIDSPSGSNFLGFIAALSHSISNHKISDPCPISPTLSSLISTLQSLIQSIDEIPPVHQPTRYGNPSFCTWHSRLASAADSLLLDLLHDDLKPAIVEIVPYFSDAFGNASRIDYGTGHETNFAAFLYCLARLGLIKEEDYQAVVSRVFVKYLELMRKLQMDYCLEPAGSHGVWGLDDYHFLPFIFGSAQLIGHKYMKPKSIHNEDILENFSKEFMYLSCVAFVRKVKKGVFAEHSPLLDDISGVPNWNKVNGGLLKMYKAEVLEKVPIMQHFLFGSIIKWD